MKKTEPLQFVQGARHVVVCRVLDGYRVVARCLFVFLARILQGAAQKYINSLTQFLLQTRSFSHCPPRAGGILLHDTPRVCSEAESDRIHTALIKDTELIALSSRTPFRDQLTRSPHRYGSYYVPPHTPWFGKLTN